MERSAIWDNIQRFRDLLRQGDVQDHRAAETVKELLSQELSKLAELEKEERDLR